MLIGITGKSGSGKTYISEMLESMNPNIISLNIDKVGHLSLLNKEIQIELVKTFGPIILNDDTIDRKKLGQLVFNSKEKMDLLTDITWPFMKKYIEELIEENKDKIIILEWALLPQTEFFTICDLKILVDVPYEIRLKRAMKRDGITKEAFATREQASIPYNKYTFDYIIDNSVSEETKGIVKKLYDKSIIHG